MSMDISSLMMLMMLPQLFSSFGNMFGNMGGAFGGGLGNSSSSNKQSGNPLPVDAGTVNTVTTTTTTDNEGNTTRSSTAVLPENVTLGQVDPTTGKQPWEDIKPNQLGAQNMWFYSRPSRNQYDRVWGLGEYERDLRDWKRWGKYYS